MPMAPFYSLFPALALKETRQVSCQAYSGLPDGDYGFLELYCNEVGCDCRRVMINVLSPDTALKVWATINYGWESVDFYARWLGGEEFAEECKGPSIDFINEQTEYAPVLLDLFKRVVTDQSYVERLKRHYGQFKAAIEKTKRPKRLRSEPGKRKRGRTQ